VYKPLTKCTGSARLGVGIAGQAGVVLGADSKKDKLEALAIWGWESAPGHHVFQAVKVGLLISRLVRDTPAGSSNNRRHDRGESHGGREDKLNEIHGAD
jgi:hypothetical protein